MRVTLRSPWILGVVAAALIAAAPLSPSVLPTAAEAAPPNPAQTPPQDPAAQAPVTPAPAAPQAIPATAVPREAEAVDQRLTEINRRIDVDPPVATIEAALPAVEERIAADYDELEAINLDAVQRLALEDLQRTWAGHRQQVREPLLTVTRRYEGLEDDRAELQARAARWQLTLDANLESDQPEELTGPLRDRVNLVLQSIRDTQTRLQIRSAAVLALQSRVSSLDARVSEATDRVTQLDAEVRQRVLSQDAVPLWAAGAGDFRALIDEASATWVERRSAIGAPARSCTFSLARSRRRRSSPCSSPVGCIRRCRRWWST